MSNPPAGAQLSDDGHYGWDENAQEWHLVDHDQSGVDTDATAPAPAVDWSQYPTMHHAINTGPDAFYTEVLAEARGELSSSTPSDDLQSREQDCQTEAEALYERLAAFAAAGAAFGHSPNSVTGLALAFAALGVVTAGRAYDRCLRRDAGSRTFDALEREAEDFRTMVERTFPA